MLIACLSWCFASACLCEFAPRLSIPALAASLLITMKFFALINLFILLVFIPTTTCAQQENPKVFANRFYQTYLELNVRGLPDEKELKLLSPYLSEDLRQLFEKAQFQQKRFIQENPVDMKPPWVDGDMFTSLFEGARSFKVGAINFCRSKLRGIAE